MLTLSRHDLISFLPKNSNVIEIGVDNGDFSKHILKKSNPKKLFLIDPWIEMLDIQNINQNHSKKYDTVKEMFSKDPRVVILKKSSSEALTDIDDGSIDWIYIDGDHKYESCLADLQNYADKVKDDGYICGHDWVTRPKKGFGINQAVEDFIKESGFILCGLTNEENFKSYVIAKNKSAKERFFNDLK
jgi:hypothetical protein